MHTKQILTVAEPTADRTITLPNATGTVVLQDSTDTLTNKTIGAATIAGHLITTQYEAYDPDLQQTDLMIFIQQVTQLILVVLNFPKTLAVILILKTAAAIEK